MMLYIVNTIFQAIKNPDRRVLIRVGAVLLGADIGIRTLTAQLGRLAAHLELTRDSNEWAGLTLRG